MAASRSQEIQKRKSKIFNNFAWQIFYMKKLLATCLLSIRNTHTLCFGDKHLSIAVFAYKKTLQVSFRFSDWHWPHTKMCKKERKKKRKEQCCSATVDHTCWCSQSLQLVVYLLPLRILWCNGCMFDSTLKGCEFKSHVVKALQSCVTSSFFIYCWDFFLLLCITASISLCIHMSRNVRNCYVRRKKHTHTTALQSEKNSL